jgi:hypothetical protein
MLFIESVVGPACPSAGTLKEHLFFEDGQEMAHRRFGTLVFVKKSFNVRDSDGGLACCARLIRRGFTRFLLRIGGKLPNLVGLAKFDFLKIATKTGNLAKLSNLANFSRKRRMIAASERTLQAFRAIMISVAPMGCALVGVGDPGAEAAMGLDSIAATK